MSEYVSVGRIEDLAQGEGRCVDVNGVEVALFNLGGEFYAIDNNCTHQAGPLCEGDLDGEDVICPWHGWRYNIKTGVSPSHPSVQVKNHLVKIENGEVKIALAQT